VADRCRVVVVPRIRDVRIGVHVCRGNWSRDETTLLSGGYQPLAPYLERLDVAQLVLEYATDRAGDLMSFGGKELGLGVVNPRTDAVESSAAIRAAVEDALHFYPPDRIFLNPDCGFGTFSGRPMNTSETAAARSELSEYPIRDNAEPTTQGQTQRDTVPVTCARARRSHASSPPPSS
jgi:5-methyltetrahydropteroyltriglutamate--homocysteine methyltransferase